MTGQAAGAVTVAAETVVRRSVEEANAMVMGNLGLVSTVVRRFGWAGIEWDDLDQIARLGLVKASRDYDPSRAAFSTHACNYMRNEILNAIRSHQRQTGKSRGVKVVRSDDDVFFATADYREQGLAVLESEDAWRAAMCGLDERERLVMSRRFKDDATLDEIGRELGLTRERVRQIEAQALVWVKATVRRYERDVRARVASERMFGTAA